MAAPMKFCRSVNVLAKPQLRLSRCTQSTCSVRYSSTSSGAPDADDTSHNVDKPLHGTSDTILARFQKVIGSTSTGIPDSADTSQGIAGPPSGAFDTMLARFQKATDIGITPDKTKRDLSKIKLVTSTSLVRTDETNPDNHSMNHEGRFYSIDSDVFQQWYGRGLNSHFYRMCKCFSENCMMVRRPAVELIDYLKAANYSLPAIRYMLYGHMGTGKSSTLAHVMHYCGSNGWLVLHLPWAATYSRYMKEIEPSTFKPGRLDQPIEAAEWLIYFNKMNESMLNQLNLTCSQKYTWSRREVTDEGEPLMALVDLALSRAKYSCDILGVILKEIKLQAETKGFKVLIAVDGVNSMWGPTVIKTEQNRLKYHQSGDLTIIQHWRKLLANDWKNGAVVCTLDSLANTEDRRGSYLPKYLLGREGFEFLDPYIPVDVCDYSDKEMYSCLQYYMDRKWMSTTQALSEDGQKEIRFLSGQNPFQVYRVSAQW